MAKISILTTKLDNPEDPSLTSDNWNIRNYRESAYGEVGEIKFNTSISARYVAVYSSYHEPLNIAEVEIYGKCALNYNKGCNVV